MLLQLGSAIILISSATAMVAPRSVLEPRIVIPGGLDYQIETYTSHDCSGTSSPAQPMSTETVCVAMNGKHSLKIVRQQQTTGGIHSDIMPEPIDASLVWHKRIHCPAAPLSLDTTTSAERIPNTVQEGQCVTAPRGSGGRFPGSVSVDRMGLGGIRPIPQTASGIHPMIKDEILPKTS